jgi:hypothetical protein
MCMLLFQRAYDWKNSKNVLQKVVDADVIEFSVETNCPRYTQPQHMYISI